MSVIDNSDSRRITIIEIEPYVGIRPVGRHFDNECLVRYLGHLNGFPVGLDVAAVIVLRGNFIIEVCHESLILILRDHTRGSVDSYISSGAGIVGRSNGGLICGFRCRSLSRSLGGYVRSLGGLVHSRGSQLRYIVIAVIPVVWTIAVRTEVDTVCAVLNDFVIVVHAIGEPAVTGGLDLQLVACSEADCDLVLLGSIVGFMDRQLISGCFGPVIEGTYQIICDRSFCGDIRLVCRLLCGRIIADRLDKEHIVEPFSTYSAGLRTEINIEVAGGLDIIVIEFSGGEPISVGRIHLDLIVLIQMDGDSIFLVVSIFITVEDIIVAGSPVVEGTNQIISDHRRVGGRRCDRFGRLCRLADRFRSRSFCGYIRRLGRNIRNCVVCVDHAVEPIIMTVAIWTEVDIIGTALGHPIVIVLTVGEPLVIGGPDLEFVALPEIDGDLVLFLIIGGFVSREYIFLGRLPPVEGTHQIIHGSLCGSFCGRDSRNIRSVCGLGCGIDRRRCGLRRRLYYRFVRYIRRGEVTFTDEYLFQQMEYYIVRVLEIIGESEGLVYGDGLAGREAVDGLLLAALDLEDHAVDGPVAGVGEGQADLNGLAGLDFLGNVGERQRHAFGCVVYNDGLRCSENEVIEFLIGLWIYLAGYGNVDIVRAGSVASDIPGSGAGAILGYTAVVVDHLDGGIGAAGHARQRQACGQIDHSLSILIPILAGFVHDDQADAEYLLEHTAVAFEAQVVIGGFILVAVGAEGLDVDVEVVVIEPRQSEAAAATAAAGQSVRIEVYAESGEVAETYRVAVIVDIEVNKLHRQVGIGLYFAAGAVDDSG